MWEFPLFPQTASTIAPRVDAVYFALLLISFAFVFAFGFAVLFFAIKYRRGSKADRSGIKDSSVFAEAIYITFPTLLGLGLFVWGAVVYFDMITPPGDSIEVYVIGKQWMWKAQHPQGASEINELHVPVGRPIRLIMTSQDVIHSYFIPDFRVKQDVLPGRYTTVWFEPTKVGSYRIFCAEYCGTDHSRMGGWVHVMEQADYERWLEAGSGSGMAAAGEELFRQYHCSGCHGANPAVDAPPLEGVFGGPVPILAGDGGETRVIIADERYIRDSILLPEKEIVAGYEPLMPSFSGVIPEDDLLKIIAYIKSIGRDRPHRPASNRGEGGGRTEADITRTLGVSPGGQDR